MFKINLRQLLRVLFILGLLLPTYVLPSSTSNVAFAEGGVEDREASGLEELEELEEQGGACKGLEICIRGINKPDFGEEVGRHLVLSGRYPKAVLQVTLRNSDGKTVYEELIEHEGRNRVRVNLGQDFEWEEGEYTVTVMLDDRLVGDSFDLDVVELDGKLIRKNESAFDIEKIKKPLIGQTISNRRIELRGKFYSEPVEILLHLPNGDIIEGKAIKHEKKQLVVRLEEIPRDIGVYKLTITSESGDTDTINFGVGEPDREPNREPNRSPFSRGWGRCW